MGAAVCGAGKGDKRMQKLLQKLERFSQALLAPLSYLTAAGLLSGSMNLTYSGLELNDELVLFETSPEAVAQARLAFRHYRSGRSDER